MERKRSRLDIIVDMLNSVQEKGGRIKPTHMMYKSNLSHKQLKAYLEEMVESEFIAKSSHNGYEYIIIKDKGIQFLQKVREIKEFEKTFGI